MSKSAENQKSQVPFVTHGAQPASGTAQTPGMTRVPGIDNNIAGATKIWMGFATQHPHEIGPPHEHGEAETAAYVLEGRHKVWFGKDFQESIEVGPGDFIFIPAHTPHIEGNPFDEPCKVVLSRGPDNIVINLPDAAIQDQDTEEYDEIAAEIANHMEENNHG